MRLFMTDIMLYAILRCLRSHASAFDRITELNNNWMMSESVHRWLALNEQSGALFINR